MDFGVNFGKVTTEISEQTKSFLTDVKHEPGFLIKNGVITCVSSAWKSAIPIITEIKRKKSCLEFELELKSMEDRYRTWKYELKPLSNKELSLKLLRRGDNLQFTGKFSQLQRNNLGHEL
jgi:hypothetical protein